MRKSKHRRFKLPAKRQKELRMFIREVRALYNGWDHANLKRRRNSLPYHRRRNKCIAEKRLIKATFDIWSKEIMKEKYNWGNILKGIGEDEQERSI